MKRTSLIIHLLLYVALTLTAGKSVSVISLAGEWKFSMDSADEGITGKWFTKSLSETLILPGSMATNGKGFEITPSTKFTGGIADSSYYNSPDYARYREKGNIKLPFWLQSEKYYQGAAWYQKEVFIPRNWKKQRIELFLERCHWETRLWIGDKEVGLRNSLGTPHIYDLTGLLSPGKHRLTICVDNRVKSIDPGENSHSISDHTQTNWNGMIGELALKVKPLISVSNVQLYPDLKANTVKAVVKVINISTKSQRAKLSLLASGASLPSAVDINLIAKPGINAVEVLYPMDKNVKLWSEFHPEVYKMNISLKSGQLTDDYTSTFGMREISVSKNQLLINGKPLSLRGTLECAIFPKTGFPPTDKSEWQRIFGIAKAHGLNHFRFHSWCPPKAAFEVADEMGFYLHVEASSWCNQSTTLGDGKPFDKYLYEESERMIEAYGNHPSFCIFLYGNEPGGKNQHQFLTEFVSYWKNKDKRRIYSSGAGWPNLPVNDFLSSPNPRIQAWGEGLKSIINALPPASDYDWTAKISKLTQPMVSHEIGQWCVYPDFKEIKKYDGVVRARNFEIFQETLKENGMGHLADSFLLASGKLQALCYKADVEAALRTKNFGGFQLLDLHDFPGQGTALVGVLNPFWGEKGYISPQEYSRFCNSTVPLIRLKKHIYSNADTLSANVEVAHYGDEALTNCIPAWKISSVDGKTLFSGKFAQTDIPLGNCFSLGQISIPLKSIQHARKLMVEVSIGSFVNSWDIWVYPEVKITVPGTEKIRVVSELDAATREFLEKGGSVLLTLKKGSLKPEYGGKIAIGFSFIFWNTAWTNGQAPHTLGILCNPAHPALTEFPTEYHSNWQWWDAMSHSNAIMLASLSSEIRPIVRVIDDWFTNRSLALLFEVKVGQGKLMVSGIDFISDIDKRLEAQQLLYSIKNYMAGVSFNPIVAIEANEINKLLK